MSNNGLNTVGIDTRVTIRDMQTQERFVFVLVSPGMVDLPAGKISCDCPLAQGLLGSRVGEVVPVQLSAGNMAFKIIAIQPAGPD